MQIFECQACGQLLYFENVKCERCSRRLGYLPEAGTVSALEPAEEGAWTALAAPRGAGSHRFCANAEHDVCNWLVPAGSGATHCLACRHNRTIPDLGTPGNLEAWRRLEAAKHRLFYTLLKLRLPLATRLEDPEHGLAFDFLADPPEAAGPKVMTGHDNGVITIALKEADDAEREKMRTRMGEPYRTLLGHFRHEVGHHFWDLLVRDEGRLDACRALFGDDREDYNEALQRHYREGVPANWQESYISAYATTHPWEDFAETWAHYLHIVDTLEMANSFGLRVAPKVADTDDLTTEVNFDPYLASDVGTIVDAWLPVSFALNSLNRSMGQHDLYPFILSVPVVKKLGFIHEIVHAPHAKAPAANG